MSRRMQINEKTFEYLVVPDTAANDEKMVSPDLRLALELKMNAPDAAAAAAMSRRLLIPDATGGFAMRGKIAANMDTKRTKPEQDAARDLEIDLIRTLADDIPGNAALIAALNEMIGNAPDITLQFTEAMRDFAGQIVNFQSLIGLASLPNTSDRIMQQIQELGAAIAENIKILGQMIPLPPAFMAQTQALFSKTSEAFALPLLATLLPMTADIPLSSKNNGTLQQAPALHQQLHAVLAQVVAATGGKMTRDVTTANMALAPMSENDLPSRAAMNAVLDVVKTTPLPAQSALFSQMDGVQNAIAQIRSDQLHVPPSTVRDMDNLANTLSRMHDVMMAQAVMIPTGMDEKIAVIDRAVAALSETGPITPAMIADIRQMTAVLPDIVPTLMQPGTPAAQSVNADNVPPITAALAQVVTQLKTGMTTQNLSLPAAGPVVAPTIPVSNTIDNQSVEPQHISLVNPPSSPAPSSGLGPVVRDNVPDAPPPHPTGYGGGGGDRVIPPQDYVVPPPIPLQPISPPSGPSEPPRVSEVFKKVCPKTGTENCGCDTVENKEFKAVKESIQEKAPIIKTVDYHDVLKKMKESVGAQFKTACGPNCKDESHGHGVKATTMGTTGDKLKTVTADDFDDPFGSESTTQSQKPKGHQHAPGVAA